ncbi:MAG: VF530 family protein [Lentimicrobiaceae bacterium]
METQQNNPLHGITLEQLLIELLDHYGWERMSYYVDIRCFKDNPSIQSSLKFLRKTPWARQKVEELYISMMARKK